MWSVSTEVLDRFCESLNSVTPRCPIIYNSDDGKIYFSTQYIVDFNSGFHYLDDTISLDLDSVIRHINLKPFFENLHELLLDIEFLYSTNINESLINSEINLSNDIILYKEDYCNRWKALGVEKEVYFNDNLYKILKLLDLLRGDMLSNKLDYFICIKFFILTSYLYVNYYESEELFLDVNAILKDGMREFTFENWYNCVKKKAVKKLKL